MSCPSELLEAALRDILPPLELLAEAQRLTISVSTEKLRAAARLLDTPASPGWKLVLEGIIADLKRCEAQNKIDAGITPHDVNSAQARAVAFEQGRMIGILSGLLATPAVPAYLGWARDWGVLTKELWAVVPNRPLRKWEAMGEW